MFIPSGLALGCCVSSLASAPRMSRVMLDTSACYRSAALETCWWELSRVTRGLNPSCSRSWGEVRPTWVQGLSGLERECKASLGSSGDPASKLKEKNGSDIARSEGDFLPCLQYCKNKYRENKCLHEPRCTPNQKVLKESCYINWPYQTCYHCSWVITSFLNSLSAL